jgi:hypothetical protein
MSGWGRVPVLPSRGWSAAMRHRPEFEVSMTTMWGQPPLGNVTSRSAPGHFRSLGDEADSGLSEAFKSHQGA